MAVSPGPSSSHALNSVPLYHNKPPVVPSSHVYSASSLPPTQQLPLFPVSSLTVPSPTPSDLSDNSTLTANLVKPSSFSIPPSSSAVYTAPMTPSGTTTAVHPLLNLQRDHGSPMLQPFSPPVPPLSFTANPAPTSAYVLLRKEKVQQALAMLVQVF